MTIAEGLQRKDNNFNLLRMVGALFILFGHCILLTGRYEPLRRDYPVLLDGIELGAYNFLNIFFVFSGLMVAMSLDRRKSLANYAAARVLRILPPLLLVSATLAVVIGPFMTKLSTPEYFADLQTWLYIPLAGSGLFVPGLPAVFTDLPIADRINPSTWTVRYEIIFYCGLAMFWLLGLLRPAGLPPLLAAGAAIYIYSYSYSMSGAGIRAVELFNPKVSFGMCFMIGTAIYFYRHRIRVSGWPILLFGLLTFLFYDTGLRQLLSTLAFTAAILWLGFVPQGSILAYNRIGELSYSIYLWHWPIGQTLFSVAPGLAFYEFFVLLTLFSLAIAALSWNLVERPALQRVPQLARWLEQCTERLHWLPTRYLVSRVGPQRPATRVANGKEAQRPD
jgi:peptidoglycan/LPS O-acetylase OafA/YrhL